MTKGYLVSVGGAEDKGTDVEEGFTPKEHLTFFEIGILKTITDLLPGQESRIEVITTASSIPDEVGDNYLKAFTKLHFNNVGILEIKSREDTLREDFIQRIKDCDCVMFTGGN